MMVFPAGSGSVTLSRVVLLVGRLPLPGAHWAGEAAPAGQIPAYFDGIEPLIPPPGFVAPPSPRIGPGKSSVYRLSTWVGRCELKRLNPSIAAVTTETLV